MEWTLAQARTRVSLGQELGRGGEGAVFALPGLPGQVAKVYWTPPEPNKSRKLSAMAEVARPPLVKVAAWPTDLLLDRRGVLRGFVMPRLTAQRDIHELYSPKSRYEAFPEADFRFLVHVAANVARAFAMVHEQGHVLGDVNHGNLLVSPAGTVMLIDCDSFQIRHGEAVFPCDVGVPLFTAPELQGRPFRGLHRTADHDRFGLAVLLFHLLYMGRHPFAGRFLGAGDMPIERAIAEHRFAYGPDRMSRGMERPPGAIQLEAMGGTVTRLMVQAFGPEGRRGRPDGPSWVEALEHLKGGLRACPRAVWHHFPAEAGACPWCEVESRTGARLFGQRIPVPALGGAVDLATLWRAISAVPDPGADPVLPPDRPWSPPAGLRMPRPWRKGARIAASFGLVVAGLGACTAFEGESFSVVGLLLLIMAGLTWRVPPTKRAEAEREAAAAQAKWHSALAVWRQQASRDRFAQLLSNLEQAKAELAHLPAERRRRLTQLEERRPERQRELYLDRFRIDRARIRGIGPSRIAMLAGYGIETAADVQAVTILRIPGFGPALTDELVRWRRGHEANFRFDPAVPVDNRDVAAVDRELEARRQEVVAALRKGPADLLRLGQEIAAARQRLMPRLEAAWTEAKLAEARRKAL